MGLSASSSSLYRPNRHGWNTLIAGLAASAENSGLFSPFTTSVIALSSDRARAQQASVAPIAPAIGLPPEK